MDLLGLCLLVSQLTAPSPPTSSPMILHFIDVGYGDAILIQLPDQKTILIDGGHFAEGPRIVRFLRKHHIHQLDAIFVTHFHKDHAGGLLPILQKFLPQKTSKVFLPFFPETIDPELVPMIEEIKRHPYRILRRGEVIKLSPSVHIEALHPTSLIGNQNEDSLVLNIIHGTQRFLLAADISLLAQRELLENNEASLKSNLLKIPHHAGEVLEDFIQQVNPDVAVLTIGSNPYGSPKADVLKTYKKQSRRFFRTDQHGDITVTSDGHSLQIETEREGSPLLGWYSP